MAGLGERMATGREGHRMTSQFLAGQPSLSHGGRRGGDNEFSPVPAEHEVPVGSPKELLRKCPWVRGRSQLELPMWELWQYG